MEKLRGLIEKQLKLIDEFNHFECEGLGSEIRFEVKVDYENKMISINDGLDEEFKEYKIYEFNEGIEWAIEGDMSGWCLDNEIEELINRLDVNELSEIEYITEAEKIMYIKAKLEDIYFNLQKNDKDIKNLLKNKHIK